MPWKPGGFHEKQNWTIENKRTISNLRREFDSSGSKFLTEYNSLQDPNLRTFYSNERNLKRLRQNGEITNNNDVICNLKDFNQYRQQLHKSRLCKHEINRREEERHGRILVANAEYITSCVLSNQTGSEKNYNEVMFRKTAQDQKKREHFQKLLLNTLHKIAHIKEMQTLNFVAVSHKKAQRQLKLKDHLEKKNDIQRKQLISLKKLFQLKRDRLRKNIIRLNVSIKRKAEEKNRVSWQKRLSERLANQDNIRILLEEVDKKRKYFVENHKRKHQQKWIYIQEEIKKRALHGRRKKLIWLSSKYNKPMHSFCADFQSSFDKLLDEDVCKAVNTALNLEDGSRIPFDDNDPIYKAAQFIMQHILAKFRKDLSLDKVAYKSVCDRIQNFFVDVKKFVLFRSTQIISSTRESAKVPANIRCKTVDYDGSAFRHICLGRVSFSKMPSTIGTSSYEIHPFTEIRDVVRRRPTPAGSLASLVVDSTTSLIKKTQSTHLSRNDLVFIEHYVTKFKRELIVGVDRRVFAAVQCHLGNRIMKIRPELLEIDRNFLVKQTTKSILRYSINPLDFESNLRLCISALSSDIIWSLQNVLLNSRQDPRILIKPRLSCRCIKDRF